MSILMKNDCRSCGEEEEEEEGGDEEGGASIHVSFLNVSFDFQQHIY